MNYQKKTILLSAKVYGFFLGTMYFISLDGSQSMFIYQPTPDTLELKKKKKKKNAWIMLLVGNQREYTLLNLCHFIQLS